MKSIKESIIGRKGSRNIKQSLRNGDVVETRQGTYSIYIQNKDVFWSGLNIIRGKTTIVSNPLNGWDESLIALNSPGEWDVVKIYRKPVNKTFPERITTNELLEYLRWIRDNVKPIVINQ